MHIMIWNLLKLHVQDSMASTGTIISSSWARAPQLEALSNYVHDHLNTIDLLLLQAFNVISVIGFQALELLAVI